MSDITFDEVKAQALSLGFDDAGITTATISKENRDDYEKWLSKEHHGDMQYMENGIRCHPDQLFPGAKTAILFISYYKQPSVPFKKEEGLIASYARGRDYHNVHHRRLKKMIKWLEKRCGRQNIAKAFSDSTPLLEKALAVQAGLGWFGKNTLLIHRRFGTFTLLSGLLTTLEFPTKLEMRLHRCGVCTKCLDACPTQALIAPYQLDARKCLSYHLIESKKEIPEEIAKKNPGYVFGCDICQDVCPHNMRKNPSTHSDFSPERGLGIYLTDQKIYEVVKQPEKLFGTPLKRRGAKGLLYTRKIQKKTASTQLEAVF